MTLINIFLLLLSGLTVLVISFYIIFLNEITGLTRLFSWLKIERVAFKKRGNIATSEKDKQAIQETLNTCNELKQVNLEEWDFKVETFSLIEKIACIYHPNANAPMENACLGDVLDAVQEANQKVLNIICLPRINCVTEFRLIQVFRGMNKSSRNKNKDEKTTSFLKLFFLRPFFLIWQKRIVRSLLTQWVLLVAAAALKIYGSNSNEEEVEAESILNEWENLQDDTEVFLPENVSQIREASKKKVLLSTTSVSWRQVGGIYFDLANEIAQHYHSQSSYPLYEVRIYDLLKSISDSLDGIGRLGKKPVLNNLLKIQISQLTKVRDIALPIGQNKVYEWANKFQVGSIAKWSHTLYRVIQKRQPGILFRDVALGLVKEGGTRWLVLFFHDKVAVEANKLYGGLPKKSH